MYRVRREYRSAYSTPRHKGGKWRNNLLRHHGFNVVGCASVRNAVELVLSRGCDTAIQIGSNITIKVLSIRKQRGKLGVEVPSHIRVLRTLASDPDDRYSTQSPIPSP